MLVVVSMAVAYGAVRQRETGDILNVLKGLHFAEMYTLCSITPACTNYPELNY
jgi:hypothetical protein